MRLFWDASAFIALAHVGDKNHSAARDVLEGLGPTERGWTSDYVLDETVTRMLYLGGHAAAVKAGEAIRNSTLVRISKVTADDVEAAWALFVKYKGQGLSFTDCTILVQAQRSGVGAIFTFDGGFRKVKAKTVP